MKSSKQQDADMMSDSQVFGIITLFLVGVTLIFICFVLLLYFGIAFAYPYHVTVDFENADVVCKVDSSVIDQSLIPCTTLNGKRSSYKCVMIRATFTKRDGEDVNDVQVYKDYRGIEKQDRCFHHPVCQEDFKKSDEEIDSIHNYYQKGRKFICYYNFVTDREVVVEKVLNTTVLHMMLWPSFGVVAGVISTIVVVIPMKGGHIISTCCFNVCRAGRRNKKYAKKNRATNRNEVKTPANPPEMTDITDDEYL